MESIVLEPVVQFTESCEKIANTWNKFSFSNPHQQETPGQHFGRIGSVDGVKQAFALSQKMDQPWAHIVIGVAGTALGVFALASGAGVVGLGVAAAFAGGSAFSFSKSKKRDETLRSDVALAEDVFPKMQKDLNQILGRGVELGRSANQAFHNGELSDNQRRSAIRDIHRAIRQFSTEELGIDKSVLDSRESKIKSPHNSTEVIDQVTDALDELVGLHDDPGVKPLQPIERGTQRGVEHGKSSSRNHEISNDDIDPLGI